MKPPLFSDDPVRAPNVSRHLRQARGQLFATSALLLLEALIAVLIPLPVLGLIDGLLVPVGSNHIPHLLGSIFAQANVAMQSFGLVGAFLAVGGILTLLTLLSAFCDYIERTQLTRLCYQVVEALREDLLARLMTRRQQYLERKRKSDLVARISTDAATLEHVIASGLITIGRAIPTLILFFVLLVTLNVRLTLLLWLAMPLIYVLNLRFSRGARAHVARLRNETQHFENEASRLLASAPAVKALTLENFALSSLHKRLESVGRNLLNLRRYDGALTVISSGSRHFLRSLILLIGGVLVLEGTLTLGGLAVFLIAIEPLSRALGTIANFISDYGKAETSVDRIEGLFQDLDGQGELQGTQAFISLPFPDATTLHFEDVSFGYPNAPALFERFNASIQAGELIAVMGPSGSGRTTFGWLINRLLDPTEGRLLLGRTDLKKFRLEVLRSYVTLVDSEPFFIPGTIRENLLMGEESSETREREISEALHATNAYDFVMGLPEKLETEIGEGGYGLSASQQRRLALTRALLRSDSQIMIFDEPLLGLDPDSVSRITDTINDLAERGVMVFWITNRLEEIKLADRVIFFGRSGHPVVGTHPDLTRQDPIYRSYFAAAEAAASRSRGPKVEQEV